MNRVLPIFAIIFATSAIYNCYLLSNKVILLLDSSHYLITVQHLHAFCIEALSGHLPQAWATLCSPQVAADIMIDGPILSALGVMGFLMTGLAPQATNWSALALVLSACLATMGCCVGITIENCTRKSHHRAIAGCIAALLAGINPEGLIAASRYLTELPSATILALIIALSSSVYLCKIGSKATCLIYLALPFLAFSGFLLKPALGPANFLLVAIVFLQTFASRDRKKAIAATLFMLFGLLTILTPWLIYTKQATGQIHLSPERMPLFNLAKGNDLKVDAFSSNPTAISSLNIEKLGNASKIFSSTWSSDPIGLSALYLRKLQRIIMTPWNDFIQTPYGIPEMCTRLCHYYLVLTAIAGTCLTIFGKFTKNSKIFLAATAFVLGATIILYIPFEGICRYGYPLNPLLFIFSGIWHLHFVGKKLAQSAEWALSTTILSTLLCATPAITNSWQVSLLTMQACLSIVYLSSSFVWIKSIECSIRKDSPARSSKNLTPIAACIGVCVALGAATNPDLNNFVSHISQTENRVFKTDLSSLPNSTNSQRIFIINARINPSQTHITLKTKQAAVPLTPIRLHMLDSKTADLANLNRMYAEIHGCSADDFFNWYALIIPESYLPSPSNKPGEISISGCDLICSRDKKDMHLSDWRYFSSGKLCNMPTTKDSRLNTSLPMQQKLSPLKLVGLKGNQQPHVFQCHFDLKQSEGHSDSYRITLTPQDFDPIFRSTKNPNSILIDKTRLKMARRVSVDVNLKPTPSGQAFIKFVLNGKVRSTKKNRSLGILITLSNKTLNRSVVMPYCPAGIATTTSEMPFEIEGLANLSNLDFIPTSVDIAFFPREWPQYTLYGADRFCGSFEVRDLTLAVKNPDLPVLDLDDLISNRER